MKATPIGYTQFCGLLCICVFAYSFFFNQHIQCRLRKTHEKPLTGTQTVLRPKWKIRMSLIICTRTISINPKSLDRMSETVFRHCKKLLFCSVHTEEDHIFHEKAARIIFEIIFLIGLLQ